jgi:hypothetical protein
VGRTRIWPGNSTSVLDFAARSPSLRLAWRLEAIGRGIQPIAGGASVTRLGLVHRRRRPRAWDVEGHGARGSGNPGQRHRDCRRVWKPRRAALQDVQVRQGVNLATRRSRPSLQAPLRVRPLRRRHRHTFGGVRVQPSTAGHGYACRPRAECTANGRLMARGGTRKTSKEGAEQDPKAGERSRTSDRWFTKPLLYH